MYTLCKMILIDGLYRCEIYRHESLAATGEQVFETSRPMGRDELQELLKNLGFPERDVWDEFASAEGRTVDPNSEQGMRVNELHALLKRTKGQQKKAHDTSSGHRALNVAA